MINFPRGMVYLRAASWGLSYLLYTLMICQIFCNNLCAKLYIYADDIKLFRHIRKSEDQDNLQSDINKVKEWANEWLLKLNVEKCCSICHSLQTLITHAPLNIT